MDIKKLIQLAKENSGITSDLELTREMGLSHGAIHHMKSGRSLPNIEHAHHLAKLAGLDPAQVIIELQIQGAKKPEVRQTLERLKSALLAAILIVPQCILCKIDFDTDRSRFAF